MKTFSETSSSHLRPHLILGWTGKCAQSLRKIHPYMVLNQLTVVVWWGIQIFRFGAQHDDSLVLFVF